MIKTLGYAKEDQIWNNFEELQGKSLEVLQMINLLQFIYRKNDIIFKNEGINEHDMLFDKFNYDMFYNDKSHKQFDH